MLNEYHKQRNKASLDEVAERSKRSTSKEQMREQIQKLYSETNEEADLTSDEEKRKIFEASPQRKDLLLSLDERDKQTIVEAIEITIIDRLTSDELSGVPDFGVKRFIAWRRLAMNLDVKITMTPRHPIINFIRNNLLRPIEQQIQESDLDSGSIEVMNEKILYYTNLIRILKFEKVES